ncbi:MAG: hypothetical protein D6820_12865, partial [Lentisphaerae bacterium]
MVLLMLTETAILDDQSGFTKLFFSALQRSGWRYFLVVGLFFACVQIKAEEPVKNFVLVSDHTVVKPGQQFMVMALFELDAEWHLYWRNPGDSGLPTRLNWQLPQHVKLVDEHWPVPIRFDTPMGPDMPPLTSYGYRDRFGIVYTFRIDQDTPPGMIEMSVQAQWLACKTNCRPGKSKAQL